MAPACCSDCGSMRMRDSVPTRSTTVRLPPIRCKPTPTAMASATAVRSTRRPLPEAKLTLGNVAVHLRRHSQGGHRHDDARRRGTDRRVASPTTARNAAHQRGRLPRRASLTSQAYSADTVTALMVISKATPVVTWNNPAGHLQPGAADGRRAERDGECAGHVRLHAGPRCDSARWSPADTLGRSSPRPISSTTTSPPRRSRST